MSPARHIRRRPRIHKDLPFTVHSPSRQARTVRCSAVPGPSTHVVSAQSDVQLHCHAPTAIDSTSPARPKPERMQVPEQAHCITACKRALALPTRSGAACVRVCVRQAPTTSSYAREGRIIMHTFQAWSRSPEPCAHMAANVCQPEQAAVSSDVRAPIPFAGPLRGRHNNHGAALRQGSEVLRLRLRGQTSGRSTERFMQRAHTECST